MIFFFSVCNKQFLNLNLNIRLQAIPPAGKQLFTMCIDDVFMSWYYLSVLIESVHIIFICYQTRPNQCSDYWRGGGAGRIILPLLLTSPLLLMNIVKHPNHTKSWAGETTPFILDNSSTGPNIKTCWHLNLRYREFHNGIRVFVGYVNKADAEPEVRGGQLFVGFRFRPVIGGSPVWYPIPPTFWLMALDKLLALWCPCSPSSKIGTS